MMKLSEFLTKGSLFGAIESIEPFPFIVDAEELDLLLSFNCGERFVFPLVGTMTVQSVASLLVLNFRKAWENYALMEGLEINSSKVLTETVTNTETRNNTTNQVNTVSAFNDDDMVDNDGSNITGVDDVLGETVRTLTDENKDSKAAFELLNMTAKDSIIKLVLNDVKTFLTLSIY